MFPKPNPTTADPGRRPAGLSRVLRGRGPVTALAAALLGVTAAGAAWSATPAAARTTTAIRTCAVSDLYLSLGAKEGAAGSLYWPVRFTNTSTSTCALRGYPGVSVVDGAHHRIGPAAKHSGSGYGTVTLSPAAPPRRSCAPPTGRWAAPANAPAPTSRSTRRRPARRPWSRHRGRPARGLPDGAGEHGRLVLTAW